MTMVLRPAGFRGGHAILDLFLAGSGDQDLDLVFPRKEAGPSTWKSRFTSSREEKECTGWPRPGPGTSMSSLPLVAGAGSPFLVMTAGGRQGKGRCS